MTTCVVDACVAAKWLLPAAGEGLLEQANRLLERHVKRELQLLAPNLIEAEIGNVVWKAVQRNRISRTEAENSLLQFTALGIHILPTSDLLGQALQIAVGCGRSFYDSLEDYYADEDDFDDDSFENRSQSCSKHEYSDEADS